MASVKSQHSLDTASDESKKFSKGASGNAEHKNDVAKDGTQEVRCLIDNAAVGSIIGKGGANVKHVREEAGILISILKTEVKQVKDRVMIMKGQPAQIAKGVRMICELLHDSSEKKKQARADAAESAFKLLIHKTAVGAVIGKAGATIKETQQETNTRIQISNEPLANSTEKTITVSGTIANVEAAIVRILTQLRDNPVRPTARVIPYVPGQPLYQLPFVTPYAAQAPHQPSARQELAIPTPCAGSITGKGGSVIRELRVLTGTNISIAAPTNENPNERVVTITGPTPGIQAAILFIKQLVEQYQPPQATSVQPQQQPQQQY